MVALPVASALVLAALGSRFLIQPHLPPGYPFITFFPAVVLTSYLCGWRIGTLAAVASGLLAWYFFIPPFHSFETDNGTGMALVFYAVVAAMDIILISALEAAAREARAAEQLARRDATTRALLFHELQHRVSNNLQLVSALISLEARRIKDVSARKALADAGARMALVGRIQRTLHDPDRQTTSFQTMAHELITDALAVAGAEHITFQIDGDGEFGPDQTAPFALILLESVNNAIEHGFANQSRGHLTVGLRHLDDQQSVLTISDDGVGPGTRAGVSKSLGLTLVRQLARQLDGEFKLEPGTSRGAISTLTFKPAV